MSNEPKKPIPFIGPEDIGALAPEVANMVQGMANETLRQWLAHIGAPQAAFDLMDAMEIYNPLQRDSVINGDVEELEFLPKALNAIAEMGGEWSIGDHSTTIARTMPKLANVKKAK
jgi:hypothetical protein